MARLLSVVTLACVSAVAMGKGWDWKQWLFGDYGADDKQVSLLVEDYNTDDGVLTNLRMQREHAVYLIHTFISRKGLGVDTSAIRDEDDIYWTGRNQSEQLLDCWLLADNSAVLTKWANPVPHFKTSARKPGGIQKPQHIDAMKQWLSEELKQWQTEAEMTHKHLANDILLRMDHIKSLEGVMHSQAKLAGGKQREYSHLKDWYVQGKKQWAKHRGAALDKLRGDSEQLFLGVRHSLQTVSIADRLLIHELLEKRGLANFDNEMMNALANVRAALEMADYFLVERKKSGGEEEEEGDDGSDDVLLEATGSLREKAQLETDVCTLVLTNEFGGAKHIVDGLPKVLKHVNELLAVVKTHAEGSGGFRYAQQMETFGAEFQKWLLSFEQWLIDSEFPKELVQDKDASKVKQEI